MSDLNFLTQYNSVGISLNTPLANTPYDQTGISIGSDNQGTGGGSTDPANSPIPPGALGGGVYNGIWIVGGGQIQSANFLTGVSGWQILANGNVEFNAGTFRGSLVANSIDIPNTTTANSFHVDSTGNAWWGATTLGAATASVLNTGAAMFNNVVLASGVLNASAGSALEFIFTAYEAITAGQVVSRKFEIPYNKHSTGANSGFGKTTTTTLVGQKIAMPFTTTDGLDVVYVHIQLDKQGAPGDNVLISIQADSAGSPSNTPLNQRTLSNTYVGGPGSYVDIYAKVNTTGLTASTQYWVVLERSGATSDVNYYEANSSSTGSPNVFKIYNGATWSSNSGSLGFYLDVVGVTSDGKIGLFYQNEWLWREYMLGVAKASITISTTGRIVTNGYGVSSGLSSQAVYYPPTVSGSAGIMTETRPISSAPTTFALVMTDNSVVDQTTAELTRYRMPVATAISATAILIYFA